MIILPADVGIFQLHASVKEVFSNKETPTGKLVLTGAICSKFLSIFHTYFLSTFKLGIINL